MSDQKSTGMPGLAAVVAGVAIVVMTLAAVSGTDLSMGRLVVTGDSAATYDQIRSSMTLFRLGILSWLIIMICDGVAAWGLYHYFKPVHQPLSQAAGWFRVMYTAMLGTSIMRYLDVLPLLAPDAGAAGLPESQMAFLVMQSITGFQNAWAMALIVFGVHIGLIGWLAVKSDHVPTWLGWVMIAAFAGYVVTNIINLLVPGHEQIKLLLGWIFILPMFGEVYLGFWLLIRGRRVGV